MALEIRDNGEIVNESPKPLLELCIDFCARNVHYIDSLVGFPDYFAEKILVSALKQGCLDTDDKTTSNILRLYGESEFWREIKFPNLIIINEYEVSLQGLMEYTVKIDLTNIQLDDEHDLLAQLSECPVVQTLILESTGLTDKGLKKIIYPCFGGRKMPCLTYLDISGLDISEKCLNNMRHLTQLKYLLFYSDSGISNFLSFRKTQRPAIQKVTNGSLLTKLFLHWMQRLAKKKREREPVEKSGFYSSNIQRSNDKLKLKVSKNKIMFERVKDDQIKNQAALQDNKNTSNTRNINLRIAQKRPLFALYGNKTDNKDDTSPKHSKRFKIDNNENQGNDSLLDLYK